MELVSSTSGITEMVLLAPKHLLWFFAAQLACCIIGFAFGFMASSFITKR